jgi:hypothetical protein
MTSKRERKYTRTNPVAKHAHKFNKCSAMVPKKVKAKSGYIKHKNNLAKGIDNE